VAVLPGAELEGVDEDGDHHEGVLPPGPLHQGQVPPVQVAHGGYEAHPFPGQGHPEFGHGAHHLHGAQYTFPVGKKRREEKLKKKALKGWEERRSKTFREALKHFLEVFLHTTLVVMAAVALILFLGPWA
jgi:hypothetical protein